MRVLAVASGGGHWVQLMRLAPALEGHEVEYVSVIPELARQVEPAPFHCVRDANRWNKLGLLVLVGQLVAVVRRVRPEVVISTGAAPGILAIALAKLHGARSIWVDSIANVERLSLSGRIAGRCADLWITQWPELAREGGPHYFGAVL